MAILIGSLQALRWLSWLTAFLLVVLVVVQAWRGDEGAQPLANVIVAAVFVTVALVSDFAARAMLRRARG